MAQARHTRTTPTHTTYHIPLAGAATLHSGCLGRALQRAMEDHLHLANLHDAPSSRVSSEVATYRNLLQHLRVDAGQRGPLSFECREQCVLVLEAHRLLPLLPRRLAVFEQPG